MVHSAGAELAWLYVSTRITVQGIANAKKSETLTVRCLDQQCDSLQQPVSCQEQLCQMIC